MPRLALLSGANPKLVKEGPVIQLRSGKWQIESDVKDTILGVRFDGHEHPYVPEVIYSVVDTALMQLILMKGGSESHITAFVKWLST